MRVKGLRFRVFQVMHMQLTDVLAASLCLSHQVGRVQGLGAARGCGS